MQSQKGQNDLDSFPRQIIQFHGTPSCVQTTDAEEAEVDLFYEDLQDLLEHQKKKNVLFIIEEWNVKVGNQEVPINRQFWPWSIK